MAYDPLNAAPDDPFSGGADGRPGQLKLWEEKARKKFDDPDEARMLESILPDVKKTMLADPEFDRDRFDEVLEEAITKYRRGEMGVGGDASPDIAIGSKKETAAQRVVRQDAERIALEERINVGVADGIMAESMRDPLFAVLQKKHDEETERGYALGSLDDLENARRLIDHRADVRYAPDPTGKIALGAVVLFEGKEKVFVGVDEEGDAVFAHQDTTGGTLSIGEETYALREIHEMLEIMAETAKKTATTAAPPEGILGVSAELDPEKEKKIASFKDLGKLKKDADAIKTDPLYIKHRGKKLPEITDEKDRETIKEFRRKVRSADEALLAAVLFVGALDKEGPDGERILDDLKIGDDRVLHAADKKIAKHKKLTHDEDIEAQASDARLGKFFRRAQAQGMPHDAVRVVWNEYQNKLGQAEILFRQLTDPAINKEDLLKKDKGVPHVLKWFGIQGVNPDDPNPITPGEVEEIAGELKPYVERHKKGPEDDQRSLDEHRRFEDEEEERRKAEFAELAKDPASFADLSKLDASAWEANSRFKRLSRAEKEAPQGKVEWEKRREAQNAFEKKCALGELFVKNELGHALWPADKDAFVDALTQKGVAPASALILFDRVERKKDSTARILRQLKECGGDTAKIDAVLNKRSRILEWYDVALPKDAKGAVEEVLRAMFKKRHGVDEEEALAAIAAAASAPVTSPAPAPTTAAVVAATPTAPASPPAPVPSPVAGPATPAPSSPSRAKSEPLSLGEKEQLAQSINELKGLLDAQYELLRDDARRSEFNPAEVERLTRECETAASALVGADLLRGSIKVTDTPWVNVGFNEYKNFDYNQQAEIKEARNRKKTYNTLLQTSGVEKNIAGLLYARFLKQANALVRIDGQIKKLIDSGATSYVPSEGDPDFYTLLLHGVPEELIRQGELAKIVEKIAPYVDDYTHVRLPKSDGSATEMLVRSFINTKDSYQFKTYEQFKDEPEIQKAATEKVRLLVKQGDVEAVRGLPEWVKKLMQDDAEYADFCKNMPPVLSAGITNSSPDSPQSQTMNKNGAPAMGNDPEQPDWIKEYTDYQGYGAPQEGAVPDARPATPQDLITQSADQKYFDAIPKDWTIAEGAPVASKEETIPPEPPNPEKEPAPSYFDPKEELRKINTLPKEERRAALDAYKERMVEQRKGLANAQAEIIAAIRANPNLSEDEFLALWNTKTAALLPTPVIESLAADTFARYRVIHEGVEKTLAQYPDPVALYTAAFGQAPKGKVEILKSPVGVMFRLHDADDYASAYNNEWQEKEPILSPEKREWAKNSGGAMLHGSRIPELWGLMMIENVLGKSSDDPYITETLKHEEHHILNHKLFDGVQRVFQYENIKNNLTECVADHERLNAKADATPEDKERAFLRARNATESFVRMAREMSQDGRARDEILAFFAQGTPSDQILQSLTKKKADGGLYDYEAEGPLDLEKILATQAGVKADTAKDLATKFEPLKEHVFGEEYKNEIKKGLDAFQLLRDEGWKDETIRGVFLHEPLGRWMKVANRLVSKIPSATVERFAQAMGMTKEELADIEGFDKLSEGQQTLACNELRRAAGEMIDAESIKEYRETLANAKGFKGFFKRAWLGATKGYQIETRRQNVRGEVLEGKTDRATALRKDALRGIVKTIGKYKEFGVSVDPEGIPMTEFLTANTFGASPDEETRLAVARFNAAANLSARVSFGKESNANTGWRGIAAKAFPGMDERAAITKAKEDFDRGLDDMTALLMEKTKSGEKALTPQEALAWKARVRSSVRMQRFFGENPDVDEAFTTAGVSVGQAVGFRSWAARLANKGKIGAFLASTGVERVGLFLGSAGGRLLATEALESSLAAVPFVGAVVGGYMASRRMKKEYKERDLLARRGIADASDGQRHADRKEDNTADVARNVIAADVLAHKLDDLLQEARFLKDPRAIDREVADPAQREELKKSIAEKTAKTYSVAKRDEHGRIVYKEADATGKRERETEDVSYDVKLMREMRARIAYTERKMSEKLVDYGKSDADKYNAYDRLDDRILQAMTFSELTKPKTKEAIIGRMNVILDLRRDKIDINRRGEIAEKALYGGLIGGVTSGAGMFAGAYVREWLMGSDSGPKLPRIHFGGPRTPNDSGGFISGPSAPGTPSGKLPPPEVFVGPPDSAPGVPPAIPTPSGEITPEAIDLFGGVPGERGIEFLRTDPETIAKAVNEVAAATFGKGRVPGTELPAWQVLRGVDMGRILKGEYPSGTTIPAEDLALFQKQLRGYEGIFPRKHAPGETVEQYLRAVQLAERYKADLLDRGIDEYMNMTGPAEKVALASRLGKSIHDMDTSAAERREFMAPPKTTGEKASVSGVSEQTEGSNRSVPDRALRVYNNTQDPIIRAKIAEAFDKSTAEMDALSRASVLEQGVAHSGEAFVSEHAVVPGDKLELVLRNKGGMSQAEANRFWQILSPQELRDIGVSSGYAGLIREGDVIKLDLVRELYVQKFGIELRGDQGGYVPPVMRMWVPSEPTPESGAIPPVDSRAIDQFNGTEAGGRVDSSSGVLRPEELTLPTPRTLNDVPAESVIKGDPHYPPDVTGREAEFIRSRTLYYQGREIQPLQNESVAQYFERAEKIIAAGKPAPFQPPSNFAPGGAAPYYPDGTPVPGNSAEMTQVAYREIRSLNDIPAASLFDDKGKIQTFQLPPRPAHVTPKEYDRYATAIKNEANYYWNKGIRPETKDGKFESLARYRLRAEKTLERFGVQRPASLERPTLSPPPSARTAPESSGPPRSASPEAYDRKAWQKSA